MSAPAFTPVRDIAVALARTTLAIDIETIDRALEEASRAQSLGPILDPTLTRDAGDDLAEQVRLIKAFRDFRAAVETFRPSEEVADAA
jgi:hypothetical protein